MQARLLPEGDFLSDAQRLHARRMAKTTNKDPRLKDIARWVQAVRGELTQEEFAARAKISRTTVADWERGANGIDLASIEKIRAAFPDAPPFRIGAAGQVSTVPRMSEVDRKVLPHGLGGFLERYDRRLTEDEKHELQTRGAEFMLARGEPDDTYWWTIIQLWRKYDPGPGGASGG